MKPGLRILVASLYFPPEITAPAFRWGETVRCWAEEGAEVTVLTALPSYPSRKVDQRYQGLHSCVEWVDGVRVIRTWTLPALNQGPMSRSLNHLSYYLSGRFAFEERPRGFDVVIGTSPPLYAAELGSHLASLWGIPFVMEVRDLWPDVIFDSGYALMSWLKPALYGWERRLYSRASRVVTVTRSHVPMLEAKGIEPWRIAVIPPGAMPEEKRLEPMPPLRERLGLVNRFVALYLGNHGASQGLEVVVDAAALVQGDVSFVFVGDGWCKSKLIRRASELKLRNVCFLPPVPKQMTGWFYSMADVCLVPLRDSKLMRDSLPSKLLEVLNAGKPVLTNVAGEGARIIRESGSGTVLEELDANSLARALSQWSSEPAVWRARGLQGQQYVRRHFDRRILAHRYLDLLREVVQQR